MLKHLHLFKTLFLLLALVAGGNAWGADETITLTYSSFGLTNSYSQKTATVGGFGFTVNQGYKGSGNVIQMNSSKGNGTLYNTTAIPGLKSITVNVYSGNKTYTITTGTSQNPTANSQTGTTGGTYNAANGDTYFQLKVSGASYFTSIVITYTPSHTLTYSATNGNIAGVDTKSAAVTSGASVLEGGKVTLTAIPSSGYAFTGWSVDGTGSSLTSTSTNPTTFTMGTANATVTANFEVSSTVANPTFTVPEGTYNEAQSVELNCTTDDATIYYTTDGKNPTKSSSVYSGAIAVNATTTIKAFAVKDGMDDSEISSATYTLKCATPTITIPVGAFLDTKVITMASSEGASIFYTTDGSTPSSSSTAYDPANKPSISATTTIKAIAIKDGWTNSDVATETFTKIVPMTVGEALTAIAALANNGTIANQYVSGIVSTTGSISSGSVTYYISADGTTTNQLQIYRGKGLNGADFTAETNLEAGDEVVVFGTLKNYNGNTPEFDSGSQVVKRVTKETPTFSLDITEKTLDAYTKESVDVTLTTNTNGSISCESDDEDVATVALKSGNVYTITAKSEGTATITISSAASASYKPASATVAITVTDTRADAGISFEEDAEEITWGESYSTQTLTNTNSVDVTWSSTDETVATVNSSTGAITILKAGETEIKATFAGDATYKAAVASYTLTVNKAEAGLSYTTTSFDIMLNDDSFVAPTLNNPNSLTVTYTSSNEVVAVVDENTGELAYEASAEGTAKITATFAGNDWYKSGSANYTINIIDPNVKGSKYNPYTVAEVNTDNYSGNNYVIGYIVGFFNSATKDATTTGTSSTVSNIALSDSPSEIGGANTIAVQLPAGTLRDTWNIYNNNVIGYKVLVYGNITSYFTNKTGVKNPSEITAVSVPVAISAAGLATYASDYALDYTDVEGIEAYIAKEEGSTVKLYQVKKVPVGTGVLLRSTNKETSYEVPITTAATDDMTDNIFVRGEGTAVASEAGGMNNYILNVVNDKLGFYKANGQTVATNRAYLQTSVASARIALDFDDETTGIKSLTPALSEGEGAVYDMQGRKVKATKKGLYIINGRKVVIK